MSVGSRFSDRSYDANWRAHEICICTLGGLLGTRTLEPHHIPGVLPLFCYLMTFLQSGCVWLFQQSASIWPKMCHFSRQAYWRTDRHQKEKKERISLHLCFSVIYCHQAHEWLIRWGETEREVVASFVCFFSEWASLLQHLSFIVIAVRRRMLNFSEYKRQVFWHVFLPPTMFLVLEIFILFLPVYSLFTPPS